MSSGMEIRAMRAEDWPVVRAIYEQGIATRQATFETEAPAWEAWDAGQLADAAEPVQAGNRAISRHRGSLEPRGVWQGIR